jgi:NADPH-dependent 7-cyano-7-deazaguanine reductase QueF-like protein
MLLQEIAANVFFEGLQIGQPDPPLAGEENWHTYQEEKHISAQF